MIKRTLEYVSNSKIIYYTKAFPPLRGLLNHVILEGIDCMFGFVEEDRCQLSNECFSMHVVLTSTNLVGHASINIM